jgi:hypothetical protein
MYPKLKINVYFIFLNIGDLTFGIALVYQLTEQLPGAESFLRSHQSLSFSTISPTLSEIRRLITVFI